MADELQRLVERIEGAPGPDREIDCRIWCALGNADPETFFQTALMIVPDLTQWQAPRYTASIDAAMTLVPEGSRVILNVAEDAISVAIVAGTQGCARTPALALCAASLRARITERTNHGR